MNRPTISPALRPAMVLAAALCLSGVAAAKLPPPSDEAKAKAAETAAKNAHQAKVAAFELCKVEDKIVAQHFAALRQSGKEVPTPVPTPACADPGPFVYHPAAAPPSAPQAESL